MRKGFTLIELILAVTIIGIVASVAVVVLTGQTAKARDAKRRSDLSNLQQAIELYYEANNSYPGSSGCIISIANGNVNQNSFVNALVGGGFIGKIPQDPKYTGCGGSTPQRYVYLKDDSCAGGSANKYSLYATLENPTQEDRDSMNSIYSTCNNQQSALGHNYRVGN